MKKILVILCLLFVLFAGCKTSTTAVTTDTTDMTEVIENEKTETVLPADNIVWNASFEDGTEGWYAIFSRLIVF